MAYRTAYLVGNGGRRTRRTRRHARQICAHFRSNLEEINERNLPLFSTKNQNVGLPQSLAMTSVLEMKLLKKYRLLFGDKNLSIVFRRGAGQGEGGLRVLLH
eukprot:5539258-Prymnesium_polylepis.1